MQVDVDGGGSRPAKRPRESEESSARAQFIACKRCRSRKIKCNGEDPSCAGCSRANVPCVVADDWAPREYTRREFNELEEKLAHLEALIASSSPPNHPSDSFEGGRPNNEQSRIETPRFVGPDTGANFFQPMLSIFQQDSRDSLHKLLNAHVRISSMVDQTPHSCPSHEFASRAVAEYFREFYVRHPLLDQNKIQDIAQKVCSPGSIYQTDKMSILSKIQRQELFQFNMVLAIGNIYLYSNRVDSMHPFGFFTAALKANSPAEFSFGTIEDIENLLLISRFGAHYNIGCSIWELSRLCMRICVELQLHRQHSMDLVTNPTEKQRRLIAFWESYSLDRFASSTLGRPFAIEDSAIDIDLTEYNVNQQANEGDTGQSYNGMDPTRNQAVFVHLLRLDRITSNICRSMRYVNRAPGPSSMFNGSLVTSNKLSSRAGHIFTSVRIFSDRLEDWRRNIPYFQYPKCAYDTKEFFELSFQQSKFQLFRTAINSLPSWVSSPPDVLLRPCVKTACHVIALFNGLRQNTLIGSSRVHAHTIFMVSLWLIFSLYLRTASKSEPLDSASEPNLHIWLDEADDEQESSNLDSILETLAISSEILRWFADQMPDIAIYAKFFGVLKRELELAVSTTHEPTHGTREHNNGQIDFHDTGDRYTGDQTVTSTYPVLDLQSKIPGEDVNPDVLLEASLNLHQQNFQSDSLLSEIFANEHFQSITAVDTSTQSLPGSMFPPPWMDEIDYGLSGCIWDTINLNSL